MLASPRSAAIMSCASCGLPIATLAASQHYRRQSARGVIFTGRLLVEKLAREFGRRLARLEDFFFRLILEFCILVQGKMFFSGNDAKLF
jgi:hypothetical protein